MNFRRYFQKGEDFENALKIAYTSDHGAEKWVKDNWERYERITLKTGTPEEIEKSVSDANYLISLLLKKGMEEVIFLTPQCQRLKALTTGENRYANVSDQMIATEKVVPKNDIHRYIQSLSDPSKLIIFPACPNEKGIGPFIVVGRDRIFLGGWKPEVKKNGVKYLTYHPSNLFEHFLEILDETKVREAHKIIKNYHKRIGLWKRFTWRIRRDSIGVQPFYDEAVSQILSVCGVAIEDFSYISQFT